MSSRGMPRCRGGDRGQGNSRIKRTSVEASRGCEPGEEERRKRAVERVLGNYNLFLLLLSYLAVIGIDYSFNSIFFFLFTLHFSFSFRCFTVIVIYNCENVCYFLEGPNHVRAVNFTAMLRNEGTTSNLHVFIGELPILQAFTSCCAILLSRTSARYSRCT